jgi:tetratricopeptide (TPR) repeat protein
MRTYLFRGVVAVAVLCAVSVAPALAQSVVRGKVTDAQGKPVQDATVLFEAVDANRTASKDKVGTQTLNANVRQGPNNPMSFTLSASSGVSAADKEAAAAIQASAGAAVEAMKAGRHDEAITKFQEVIAKVPTCADCYYNIGVSQMAKQQQAEAEASFKKAIELKPDNADAYTALANLYNSQKKFDLAAEASANASKYAGSAGGGSAEASYNQGVILFNAGKFAEAKTQFEAATKTDPNHSMAQYQLGMTALNLGQIPEAVAALEAYLKVDPNGPKAAEVKAALPALQQMLKK